MTAIRLAASLTMANFYFSLPDDQLDRLRDFSRTSHQSIAEVLRRGADLIMATAYTPCGIVLSGAIASGHVLVLRGG
jgi:hypothetical protein